MRSAARCNRTAKCILLGALTILPARTQSADQPNAIEQKEILADATEHALNQEKTLPDFICLQTTRRFVDSGGYDSWRPIDIIVERLTYFEHREAYKVIELNGLPVSLLREQLGGASSAGEFGSLLKSIFAAESETQFKWEDLFTLRGRRAFVFSYRVLASHSKYHLRVSEKHLDLIAGYHGLVFIDKERHFVQRITAHPDDIPESFPIQDVSLILDYEYTRIGDADFLLPLQFELRSRQGKHFLKNDVDYDNYQKFTSDSNITFGAPDLIKK